MADILFLTYEITYTKFLEDFFYKKSSKNFLYKKKNLLFFSHMLLTLLPNIVFSHSTLLGQTALNNELLDFITGLQTLFSGNTRLLRAFSPKISAPALSFESTSLKFLFFGGSLLSTLACLQHIPVVKNILRMLKRADI